MTVTKDCHCDEIIEVSTRLVRTEADVMTLRADFKLLAESFNVLATRFAVLNERVAMYAGVGGIVGGIVTALAVIAIQKFIFGG